MGVFTAEFDPTDNGFETGMAHWIAKLGAIRSTRFFVLADDRLRYEIAGAGPCIPPRQFNQSTNRHLKRRGCCCPSRFPNSAEVRASCCYPRRGGAALPPGIPGEVLDLSRKSPDVAASYALFRRYLFDYRTDLLLPMLILIDERGLAHKIYPGVPAESRLREDLKLIARAQPSAPRAAISGPLLRAARSQ